MIGPSSGQGGVWSQWPRVWPGRPGRARAAAAVALTGLVAAACTGGGKPPAGTQQSTQPAASAHGASEGSDGAQPPTPSPPGGGRATVLIMGTSLTAGLGLDPDQAYPALLQRSIDSAGLSFAVENAGLSGETSAGALRRVVVAVARTDRRVRSRDRCQQCAAWTQCRLHAGQHCRDHPCGQACATCGADLSRSDGGAAQYGASIRPRIPRSLSRGRQRGGCDADAVLVAGGGCPSGAQPGGRYASQRFAGSGSVAATVLARVGAGARRGGAIAVARSVAVVGWRSSVLEECVHRGPLK